MREILYLFALIKVGLTTNFRLNHNILLRLRQYFVNAPEPRGEISLIRAVIPLC